ncbi:hypothetical protein RJ640_016480 [Escallonia rubra]|uniref:Uncharacterized protein n=1 Tax=Escallonia rubra TaxID=112253 RepID=A0AA88QXL6_9ASTE|nr:hypothetical protein RJ640_016480 [Escallonia rubra]
MEFYDIQLQGIPVYGILLAITCVCALVFAHANANDSNKGRKPPPEPAGAWPLIGHLHLLRADKLHRTLGDMADKYGPAFALKLGIHSSTLVISSWEVAKECFTTHDKIFATRPRSLAVKLMGYDHAMFGFSSYGPYWREIRKIAMVELLSTRRLDMLRHVRDTEINFFIKELYEKWKGNGGQVPVLAEMKERFGDMAMNIIVRMVAGKRYFGSEASNNNEESRRCQKAMGDFMYLVGLFTISDAIPVLSWLDTLQGYTGKMKQTAKEIDFVLGSWLEEHRRKRLAGVSIKEQEQDFIHVMLSVMDGGNSSGLDTDTVVKATCLSLILGGNDTTVITLTWALSLLLNNRHVLRRAQDELDIHVGRHRQVDEADVKDLIYLQAIVKETLRLYPALPLSAPREAMEDCTVAGFHVPAGTRLFVNLWKMHRDPSIWSDPLEFQPERFLGKHVDLDVRGQDYEFIPFGSGRRLCPGITFALQVLPLTLARLLHGFELGTISDLQVDMTESSGLTVPKATPLEVTLSPRLPSILY